MANKVYAVRKGKRTGIFLSWDECKTSIDGFSGAEYKSFKTMDEAKQYLAISESMNCFDEIESNDKIIKAYVDGSYDKSTNEFSYGMVVLDGDLVHEFSKKFSDNELASMNNVAGEIKGAEAAMQYALDNNLKKIIIYHDYEGISKWCTKEWKANKKGTKDYVLFYKKVKEKVQIEFVKVLAHSNDKYNDMADMLAKKALISGADEILQNSNAEMNNDGNKRVYLIRDKEKLNELLNEVGHTLWNTFNSNEGIDISGTHHKFTFYVDGKKAMLNIYQKSDGTTTLLPTGTNTDLSKCLKQEVELRGYKTTSNVKSYTVFIGQEWLEKTIEFLGFLCGTPQEGRYDGEKTIYQFISPIGDKLTLTVFKDNKVLVQGKPLYLYNEFISFISYSPKIEMNDIIKVTNTFNDTKGEIEKTREKLAELVPNAYNGTVDDIIWKLFSPALVLIDDEKELEDYSCCVFPALRALEGYLNFLLDEKGIVIDNKHNFSTVFIPKVQGSVEFILLPKHVTNMTPQYVKALEEIYNYFRSNRHVLFHVDQILINTRMIEERQEAITIIHEVTDLINRTYIEINP